jgi:glycosyltransferase involved in cell wall biosynthesis
VRRKKRLLSRELNGVPSSELFRNGLATPWRYLARMRIIHCLRAPVGGLFRHVLDLALQQVTLGHDVGLIADATTQDVLTQAKFEAIAPSLALGVARFPMHRMPSVSDFGVARRVAQHAQAQRCEILHGHGAKGGAYARLAGRKLKSERVQLKTFYTPHGGTLNYPPSSLEGRVFLMLERFLEPMTDGLIFESAFAARVYGERIGVSSTPRRVVPNGLREADFAPQVLAGEAADFLFVGELRALKGVDVLLRALANLNVQRAVPLRAVIVGDGPERDEFKKLAQDLNLSAVVTFPGALPAAQAFPLGRVIVVPSRKESFPYIVLEAAAAGIPVVATDVGGIPEMVVGTDTALVPPDDVGALAMAMAQTVNDPASSAARAERLKLAVARRFTVARMSEQIIGFYGDRAVSAVN